MYHILSCVVTAYKELDTVGIVIEALLTQDWSEDYEILVVCPDDPTAIVVSSYQQKYPQVRHLADRGDGKPAALNLDALADDAYMSQHAGSNVGTSPPPARILLDLLFISGPTYRHYAHRASLDSGLV
jgi:glycosyltransferase involved in cell wall biosynthesis